MRWIVGGGAVTKQAASASQMGRFETEFLATDDTIAAVPDLPGLWIDRGPPKTWFSTRLLALAAVTTG